MANVGRSTSGAAFRKLVGLAVGLPILSGTAFLLWTHRAPNGTRHEISNLIAALDRSRVGEGRFESLRYMPVASPVRSANGYVDLSPDLKIDLARLEQAVGTTRSPEALHGWAVARAVEGQLDDAVNALVESTSLKRDDATAWNDLAALYLARNRPDDLSGASDAARRALMLAPADQAARFNRALALERLHLDTEASAEWSSYLKDDPTSGWATEAKTHLRQVATRGGEYDWKREEPALRASLRNKDAEAVRRSVNRFPQQSRELIADVLLPEWARTSLSLKEPSLQDSLELSEAVAERGDRLMFDAVRSIHQTPNAALPSLAAGYVAFARGRAASGEYRYADADVDLADAETRLRRRSPVALWATMLRAVVLYQRGDLAGAAARLLKLRTEVAAHSYAALLGQIDWTLGVISAGEGDFDGAFRRYRTALAAFESVREVENAATVESLLAETTRLLGDSRGSWAIQLDALSHLSELRRPQRKQTVTMMAGQAALRQDRPSAALDFQNRFLAAAHETGSPTAVAEGLLSRARVYRRLGDSSHARQDLLEAKATLRSATQAGPAEFLNAQIQLEDALQEDKPEDSQAIFKGLTHALEYFRSSSRLTWLPRVYLARARLWLRQRDRSRAEADLLAGIETLEKQRKTVSSDTLRVSYLDESWDLFDEMIALQLDLGRQRDAFEFAERGRARSLLDAVAGEDQWNIEPSKIADSMPADSVMLYFASAGSHAVVWVLGPGVQEAVALGAAPAEIEAHARAYRREFEGRHETAAAELGTVLYRELIQPVERWLPKRATLVIAPDRALNQVPFAALQKTPRDEYLVQQHPLVLAASARLFLRANASRVHSDGPPTALVIANPSTDPSVSLPGLPGAEREATDIAAFYPGTVTFLRQEATRRKLMEIAPNATVVHIAAHALANEEFPDLSRVFLAPEGGSSGVVMVNDLRHMKFDRTRLVVLAACDTASGATFRGEGVTSLARPFLAGGVPQVVSTLWQVDDQTSRRLFTEFHRGYAHGLSAAKALQQAQIAVLVDKTLPHSSWAATVLLGSVESLVASRTPAAPKRDQESTTRNQVR